jgi:hypothetical protein
MLKEKPTGVDENDSPFGDKMTFVNKVFDVCMRKSGWGDGSPTVRLWTNEVRCLGNITLNALPL